MCVCVYLMCVRACFSRCAHVHRHVLTPGFCTPCMCVGALPVHARAPCLDRQAYVIACLA